MLLPENRVCAVYRDFRKATFRRCRTGSQAENIAETLSYILSCIIININISISRLKFGSSFILIRPTN